ncbi:hypothetical protein MLD38_032767 [Melastoma candidum]|uniref:Uncharacterized protein n=1 Tax=Melastoma candidum TaxID=119954 RepID=A0ACB9M576_9MYRT|nr:hypothetical protein MLD38_032767 [Melastoma candidum]
MAEEPHRLQGGLPLLFRQYVALFRKNVLLSCRNRRATSLQLFSSFFFVLLIFCIQKAIESDFSTSTTYKSNHKPTDLVDPPIPPCESKFFVKTPCFDFVWSGNQSARIRNVVTSILRNNPGRPIPPGKVLSFGTMAEVDAWLLANPMTCPAALHFSEVSASVIGYGVQTNSTPASKRGIFENPVFKFQIPLQISAEREIARSLLDDSGFSWVVGLKEFAHPAIETFAPVGSAFFLATAMFGFVLQIGSLVAEKELKLRQSMTLMGLFDTAYWLSWLTWEAIMTLISSLFIVLFGMMFRLSIFSHNSFLVVFLVFFLFQLNMIGFAFMLSAFISKSSSSTIVGFSIFIIGFLTQVVTASGFPYSNIHSKSSQRIWSLFPPNLLAEAVVLLSGATSAPQDPGISWSGHAKCPPNDLECVMTINDIYKWLGGTFVLWFVLAIYFDNIIPDAYGVRKPIFYFFNPCYWIGRGGSKSREGGICCCCGGSTPPLEHFSPDDEDVLVEENTVKSQSKDGLVDPAIAVQIRGLIKVYRGSTKLGCCKCKKTLAYHAIKGLWVNFTKDQLFCLLGPNGAGKTTVINCLTGIMPVTAGDALIYGYSIRSSVGMSNIRKIIGVCPQFDILWDLLSGEEHLYLFATIKGLPSASVKPVVEKSLADVRLTEAAKMRSGHYSGGMKRRLSVAIALIGDPKLVILDEPTTGMDPITRRHVWDIIEDAKKGRAIILTTHSMEEADILGDRIGIMAKGRLHCIGTSIRLKSRFGTGFIANLSFSGGDIVSSPEDVVFQQHREAVTQFFKSRLDVVPKEENNAFTTFVIPHDREPLLPGFFAELQAREREFGITDIQLGLTTLDEVFLNIVKKAELETAVAEGTFATLALSSGESLQIPVGARFIKVPGTETVENPRGNMVEVYWQQDDSGTLCISGHSSDMPIPASVQIPPSSGFSRKGRKGKARGTVLNPNEVMAAYTQ